MRGLLTKIFHETRWPVLLFGLGLAVVMGLLTLLLPKVLGDIHRVFERMAFVKPLITALLGVDPGDRMTATMSQAFLWVHPTVLTLIWAHAVLYCTRTPAGEIDRGTADFLLGLPISRWTLFGAETAGWLISGGFILACGYGGHLLAATRGRPEMIPPLRVTLFIMTNLLAVYLAVGAFAFLVSACSDRRGRAMGVIFAVLLASFLLNFIAQFWDPLATWTGPAAAGTSAPAETSAAADAPANTGFRIPGLPGTADELRALPARTDKTGFSLAAISLMDYYRPAIIIQSGQFPLRDVSILLALAAGCWLTAGCILQRRSICTV